MMISLLLAAAIATPPPTPVCGTWEWSVKKPGDAAYEVFSCEQNPTIITDVPGKWWFRLSVKYQHEAPDGGRYTAVTERMVVVGEGPIFSDGFETGNLTHWSESQQ
jgi:hypothetical protein